MKFYLLALMLSFQSAFADSELYVRAGQLLGQAATRIVRLSPQGQGDLDAYFAHVSGPMALPSDGNVPAPRVVLIKESAEDGALAFVFQNAPDVVFWNAEFFLKTTSVDVDRYVMGHERRHFSTTNRQLNGRAAEYDADIMAIGERLFRIGQRDENGNPQAAVVNVDALLNFLSSKYSYRDNYLSNKALAAGIKVAYAQERSNRPFPKTAEPRMLAPGVLDEVRSLLSVMPSTPAKKESTDTSMRSQEIDRVLSFLPRDYVASLLRLEQLRGTKGPSLDMAPRFALTYRSLLMKLATAKRPSRWLDALFDRFSQFPDAFFTNWRDIMARFSWKNEIPGLNSVIRELQRSSSLDFVGVLDFNSERRSAFKTYIRFGMAQLPGDLRVRYFAIPRALRFILETPNFDFANDPVLILLLRAWVADAATEINQSTLLTEFQERFGAELELLSADPNVWAELARVVNQVDQAASQAAFARFLLAPNFDELFPGLRRYLKTHVAATEGNRFLMVALNLDSVDSLKAFFTQLDESGEHAQFLILLQELSSQQADLFNRQNFWPVWIAHVDRPGSEFAREPYTPGLDKVLQSLYVLTINLRTAVKRDDFFDVVKRFKGSGNITKLSQSLTARASQNLVAFVRALDQDHSGDRPETYEEESLTCVLIDWDELLKNQTDKNLELVIRAGNDLLRLNNKSFEPFRQALIKRVKVSLANSNSGLELTMKLLRSLGSTSADGQAMTTMVMDKMDQDLSWEAADDYLYFLESLPITNFIDTNRFVNQFVKVLIRVVAYRTPFYLIPLHDFLGQLAFIEGNFDPLIASRILSRLAAEYRAGPELKSNFSLSPRNQIVRAEKVVDEMHLWTAVFAEMDDALVMNMISFLRGDGALIDSLKLEMAIRLYKARVIVAAEDVESYLQHRFSELSPLARAGVIHLALDGTTNLLESAAFRRQVFVDILHGLPDAKTREVFLDLWEAGMQALPNSLRSLVLSIVLSESGRVGKPERALVTLLSHMGPLEQKFGQMLAFADLPESYRQELRRLWDSAQNLGWWEAWDLITVQKGDITQAGYKLTRVLNSGSTEAFLEITHVATGRRFAISVFRDGVRHSVEVGHEQLTVFTSTLAAKGYPGYRVLPLLNADALRTMQTELDRDHKRILTEAMAQAYRAAAGRLGYPIDHAGVIHIDDIEFTSVPFVKIDLGQGRWMYAQEMADGMPLRKLEEVDPKLYRSVTEKLLRLENEVLNDPSAPVDKDRMPGQNIFSFMEKRNYILDHGQARRLSPAVHAAFGKFLQDGFACDAATMLATLKSITNFPELGGAEAASSMRGVEPAYRPLNFLAAVSAPYLALADGDPRKEQFFELVHGVRAKLRLLQWEQSEGLNTLGQAERQRVVANLGAAGVVRNAWDATRVWWQNLRQRIAPVTVPMGARSMERAYGRSSCGDVLKRGARR